MSRFRDSKRIFTFSMLTMILAASLVAPPSAKAASNKIGRSIRNLIHPEVSPQYTLVNNANDLIVADHSTLLIQNELFNQTGNVLITDSGTLIIQDSIFLFWDNGTHPSFSINGTTNATLIIKNSTLETNGPADGNPITVTGTYAVSFVNSIIEIMFDFAAGGSVTISNSTVAYLSDGGPTFYGGAVYHVTNSSVLDAIGLSNRFSAVDSRFEELEIGYNAYFPGRTIDYHNSFVSLIRSYVLAFTVPFTQGTASLTLNPGNYSLWRLSVEGGGSNAGFDFSLQNTQIDSWNVRITRECWACPKNLSLSFSSSKFNLFVPTLSSFSDAAAITIRDSTLTSLALSFLSGNSTVHVSEGYLGDFALLDNITSTSHLANLHILNSTVSSWSVDASRAIATVRLERSSISRAGSFGNLEVSFSKVSQFVKAWTGNLSVKNSTINWIMLSTYYGDLNATIENSIVSRWVSLRLRNSTITYDLIPGQVTYWNSQANGTYMSPRLFSATILNTWVGGWRVTQDSLYYVLGASNYTLSGQISRIDTTDGIPASRLTLKDASIGLVKIYLSQLKEPLTLNPGFYPNLSLPSGLNLVSTSVASWGLFLAGSTNTTISNSNIAEIDMGEKADLLLTSSVVGNLILGPNPYSMSIYDGYAYSGAFGAVSIVNSVVGQVLGSDYAKVLVSNQHSPVLGSLTLQFGASMYVTNADVHVERDLNTYSLSAIHIQNGAIFRGFTLISRNSQGQPIASVSISVDNVAIGTTNSTGGIQIPLRFSSSFQTFHVSASSGALQGVLQIHLNSPSQNDIRICMGPCFTVGVPPYVPVMAALLLATLTLSSRRHPWRSRRLSVGIRSSGVLKIR